MLKGKTIIVTGSASGLGLGIVKVALREGAHCILADIDDERLHKVIEDLNTSDAHAIRCDITSENDLERLFTESIQRYGRIHGLVNNAGVDFNKPFIETERSDWDRILQTNLTSVFSLCRRACAHFLEQGPTGGNIVNISSVHSVATVPGAGPYAVSKAGITALTQAIALEHAQDGIRANVVSPGLCDTEIWQKHKAKVQDPAALDNYWDSNIPIHRRIQPEEIGELVAFLLSDRSQALVGSNFIADGGLLASLVSEPRNL